MKIITIAIIPDDLGTEWIQHIRNFDVAHPGCEFSMLASAPEKSVDELKEMLNLEPPLQFKKDIKS